MSHRGITLSVSSFKGGISKTTALFTLGAYLYRFKKQHVLFVDTDPQKNLTSMFNLSDNQIRKHSLINVYKHDAHNPRNPWQLKPAHINRYVDIITATGDLANAEDIMRHKQTLAPFVLYHYLSAINAPKKYDYILIDTHNNFNLNTQDALVCSDYTMIPVTASRFSMDGIKETLTCINNLKNDLINPATTQSLIGTKIFLIGSIVPYNTRASHEFLSIIKKEKLFITYFHQRELFNKANFHHQDIFKEAQNRSSDEKVINNEIKPALQKIVNYISK